MKISFKWKHQGYAQSIAKHKGLLWGVRPFFIVLLLFVIVRFFLLSVVVLPRKQKAFVSLVSYGLRMPGEQFCGYHRWGYCHPEKGDEVVFSIDTTGGSKEVVLSGKCIALPNENVWIDPIEQRILPGKTSPDAQPITIPSKDHSVEITPFNLRLLAYILSHFEACKHLKITHQGVLQLDGKTLQKVRMQRDYYWIEIAPNEYLMIPHDALIGKVVKKF